MIAHLVLMQKLKAEGKSKELGFQWRRKKRKVYKVGLNTLLFSTFHRKSANTELFSLLILFSFPGKQPCSQLCFFWLKSVMSPYTLIKFNI